MDLYNMVDSSQDNINTNPDTNPNIFNYYYSKLSDVITKPEAFKDINKTTEIKKLIDDIKDYMAKKCGEFNLEQSSQIKDKDIENISKFLAHVVPKCEQTNITLEDIKNGKILSKGAFGYGFSAGNAVIKIIICKNNRNTEQIKKEINMHKVLTLLNMDIFTKLKGYFEINVRPDSYRYYTYYNYYNNSNNYEKLENCNFNLKYDAMCETYLFIEKGDHDLEKVVNIVNYNDDEMTDKKSILEKVQKITELKIVDKFEKLLTIYKTVFKMNGNVFVHSDIKTSNIVVVTNNDDVKYKLIDFGTSFVSSSFFNNAIGGTPNIFKLLYFDNFKKKNFIPSNLIVSPLYDLFCILFSMCEICIGRKPVNMGGVKDSINKFLSEYPTNDEYREQKQKLYKMFYLLEMISDFHVSIMKEFENYMITNNTKTDSIISRLSKYMSSTPKDIINFFDMKNFNFINREYFRETGLDFNIKPLYEEIYSDKIKNDVIYLDKVMCYLFGFKPEEIFTF